MLHRLEEGSEAYVLGLSEGVVGRLGERLGVLVGSSDEEAFVMELERLVREEQHELRDLVERLGSEHDDIEDTDHESTWPLVERTIREVLGNGDAAERFMNGLTLLSLRGLLSRSFEQRHAASTLGPREAVDIPDPEIWARKYEARAGDVCFAAVLTLLDRRERAPAWLATLLASTFHRGQRAGVQVLASILASLTEDEPAVDVALRLAGVERLDMKDRFRAAVEVDASLRSLVRRSSGHEIIAPFGDYDAGDYPVDDADEWIGVGEGE
jgi:hypothetical protein